MKITAISDTHSRHNDMTADLVGGDFIVHGGDISMRGSSTEIYEFLNWYGELPFKWKVFVAGNHDWGFEEGMLDIPEEYKDKGIVYLRDKMVELDGIKIYGSPWQPRFFDWAFNVDRGPAIAEKWKDIPPGLDILITHGPVWGKLDMVPSGLRVGCEDLRNKVLEVKPRFHVCGHIHCGFGMSMGEDTTYINASSVNERYNYANEPIIFNL